MRARDNPEKRREWWHRWYEKNKDKKMAWQEARREKLREWFAAFKKTLECSKCQERHPGCLVFHHTDPSKKEINVGIAITNNLSTDRIKEEISKCVVLCANCHMKLHYEERSVAKAGIASGLGPEDRRFKSDRSD